LAKELDIHYIQYSPQQTGLIDGTLPLLEELQRRGHQMWILTNGFEEVQRIKLQCCGLSPFFEAMYTSEELGVKKPHPDAFHKAAAAAGLSESEDVVMIGDSWQSDVEGAQNVGWRGVHYNPEGETETSSVAHRPQPARNPRSATEFKSLRLFPMKPDEAAVKSKGLLQNQCERSDGSLQL
jgi:HAD superfamily hydrolase (TIGR01509 family)